MLGRVQKVRGRVVRVQSVKAQILLLLAAPIAALVGLWIFAVSVTLGDSLTVLNANTMDAKIVTPTEAVIGALQTERRMSLAFLGGDPTIGRAGFDAQRAKTDQAIALFRKDAADSSLNRLASAGTVGRIRDLAQRLGDLSSLRMAIDDRVVDRSDALSRFSTLVDAAAATYDPAYPGTAELTKDTASIIAMGQALEVLSREDALITGALAAGDRLTPAEHAQFIQFVAAHRLLYTKAVQSLPDADKARFDHLIASAEYGRFQTLEDRLALATGTERHLPLDASTWHLNAEPAMTKLYDVEVQAYNGMLKAAHDHASTVLLRLGLAGGVGLLAIIASLVIAYRVGRKLIRESRALSGAVREFAQDRLPVLTEMAGRGERPDTDYGATEFDFSVREVRDIYESFVVAQRAIFTATVGEATARKGLSDVFVALARRSQTLLHRQLTLLDRMERRSDNPAELQDLFRLDHLATRMRRHAEGLVILSGRRAGRIWRNPVPLIDVVRGAASEVEDYARVRVLPMPHATLSGSAVADVVHLLAELIENATSYSPPEAAVHVRGQTVVHGFAIEIEDRGLGMRAEALAEANQKLAESPQFDMSDPSRLGLFVVARLATRHDIKVTLQASPYGGTTTIVLLPDALLVETADEIDDPDGPAELTRDPEPVSMVAVDTAPPPGELTGPREVTQEPSQPTAPPVLPRPTAAEPTEPGELPRRRRQSSLAQQLKQEPSAASEDAAVRPPEAARSLMTAMQGGWRRGRDDAAQLGDGHDEADHRDG